MEQQMRLWRQQPALTSTGPGIPAKIVVGVIGHRKLDNQAALADAVRSAIESIKQMVPPLQSTPLLLCVLSPLAEGADRLVAQEIIKVPNSMLEVVFPLEKDDYMQDFETIESKGEFEQLLSQASTVRVLPPRRSRMAIVSPAIAGNLTSIRIHHDYLRNSMRSAEMVRHLQELKNELMQVQNHDSFLRLVKETEETMLHENEDWRVVVRFHQPEVPL